LSTGGYLVADYLEYRNIAWNTSYDANEPTIVQMVSSTTGHQTISNSYAHNFYSVQSPTGSGGDGSRILHILWGGAGLGSGREYNDYVMNGEQITAANSVWNGFGSEGCLIVNGQLDHSKVAWCEWEIASANIVSYNDAWANVASLYGGHTDLIYLAANYDNASVIINNNYMHHSDPGSSSQMTQGTNTNWYIFNNVSVYAGQGAPFTIDAATPSSGTSNFYWYNNTFLGQPNGTGSCFNIGSGGSNYAGLNVNIYNNHCVSDQTNNTYLSGACTSVHSLNGQATGASCSSVNSANVMMSPTTASSQGYVVANQYQPTASSNSTATFAGSNFTSQCSGALVALCSDFNGVARSSSAAWQAGAYMLGSSSQGGPTPPSGLSASVQ
jgi:hypothetical protein